MMVFCYINNIMYFVFTPPKKLKLSDHVCTLHGDDVVSLISGCGSVVVNSCSPRAVTFYVLLLNSLFIESYE